MDLNELKNAWGKLSKNSDQSGFVKTEDILVMLSRRGSGILSKLERNVKTGFWLMGIFLLLTIADQYAPNFIGKGAPTPKAINILGIFVNLIIMLSFLLFFVRYRKLNIKMLASNNIRVALSKVIQLLDTFKKEFYLALVILSCAQGIGFVTGVWEGLQFSGGYGNHHLRLNSIILIVVIIILLMLTIIVIIFYIFHKGFDSLYGKYRNQLIEMLNELEDTEE